MKICVNWTGPVAGVLRAIARCAGAEVVEGAGEADEVLCTKAQEALDFLLAGNRVALVVIGTQEKESAEALAQNERFKDSLTVFRISFTDADGDEIDRFVNHCAGK